MKIKYWVLGLLICFLGVTGYTITKLSDLESTKVDMVEINERYQEVSMALEQLQGNDFSELEERYDCEIYWKTDSDYETNVYNAIRSQCILLDYENNLGTTELEGKIVFPGQGEIVEAWMQQGINYLIATAVILFLLVCGFGLILYQQYIYPFHKLEKFADYISKGNFDIPLPIKKRNYFGAFTESFDIMREEMKRARQSEYEANISKKELVASLSHDIKTPVATIKAICELLEVKLAETPEKEKIRIILQKADVIDRLISDMFHSTLQDLEKLKIHVSEEVSTILEPMFSEINYYDRIHLKNHVPECIIMADALRLNQVIDNLINNSYKYAKGDIDVSFEKLQGDLKISIKDYGPGILAEELPLITEKFYRGSNAKGKVGSGLGLYLSKTFMEGMGGSLTVENRDGLLVTLSLPLA